MDRAAPSLRTPHNRISCCQPSSFQSLPHHILKAKSRLILLNLSDDLLLYGAQRLLLSQSVNEFDVEVTLCINISEE
jgi:hypothetical protein